jgi:hypothetical protein
MNRDAAKLSFLLSAILFSTEQNIAPSLARDQASQLPPIDAQGTTSLPASEKSIGGLAAPGAGAIMTPDMLLVNPTVPSTQPTQPLKSFVGSTLTLRIERSDIRFDRLGGVVVSVSNETDRPLIINGEKAQVSLGGKTLDAVPIGTLQTIVIPPYKADKVFEDILTKIVPAAATIGVYPTSKDIILQSKPVLQRYGKDELRRRVESSRFGRRVLWPRTKTRGVLYFDTHDSLTGVQVQIPCTTLFDLTDAATLTSSSNTAAAPSDTTVAPPAIPASSPTSVPSAPQVELHPKL